MVETIKFEDCILAVIVRQEYEAEGLNFFTAPENPLQLGVLKHKQGTVIRPHIHQNSVRTIESIQEVVHVAYGKVEVDFYSREGKNVQSSILNVGDTVLLMSGGHGFRMIENSKLWEIKQGPYYGVEADKILLE